MTYIARSLVFGSHGYLTESQNHTLTEQARTSLRSAVPGLRGSSQSKRMGWSSSGFLLPAEHVQLWACPEASHNLAVS